MTERKVLNKYYPPDYDPSNIPKLPKDMRKSKNRTFSIRTMAPCNMRCLSCGEYIYKARKFNSRMEEVEGETYLGLRIYRFYIRCTGCCSEIVWRTDVENGDYSIEHGAKRNFEALRTAEMLEKKKQEQLAEEEAKDPMKQLEKRTNQSKQEMEMLETLQDVKELNRRYADSEIVDTVIESVEHRRQQQEQQVEDEDTLLARQLLKAKRSAASSAAAPVAAKVQKVAAAASSSKSSSLRSLMQGSVRLKKSSS